MSRQQYYFATKADMLPGLQAFEARSPLKYVRRKWRRDSNFDIYPTGFDVPNWGISTADSLPGNPEYILIEAKYEFKIETIPQKDGTFFYEPQVPRNAVVLFFQPGGLYHDTCLIAGNIYASGATPAGLSLYRRFVHALTKGFLPIRGMALDGIERTFLVGPEAQKLARSGTRLITRFVGEPLNYDLNEALQTLNPD